MPHCFYLIGDAHLGKSFKSKDIPLEMKGKREELLIEKFIGRFSHGLEAIAETDFMEGIIQLGDLFDSPNVSYDTLLLAYRTLLDVESKGVPCYILAGNHDLSKDLNRKSAMEILAEMFRDSKHIHFIINEPVLINDDVLIVPYSHFKTVEEQVKDYLGVAKEVYGHFNVEDFTYLSTNFEHVYTGHIHKPEQLGNVLVVGSILPLTFGEDANNSFMKTCSLEEYERDVAEGISESKCYRIKLKDGQELPLEKKCLQMSVYKEKVENVENISVDFDTFDLEKIMRDTMGDPDLFEEVYALYNQLRMEEASNV